MSVTVTFTCDNTIILFQEMTVMLNGMPAPYVSDPSEPIADTDMRPGNIVPMPDMKATAGAPPRRRRGKGNGAPVARMMTQEEAEAEDVAEAIKQEDEELAALAPDRLSRDEVIEQLTTIWSGADAGTRAKIKAWRNKMGYSLIRDLPEQDVPAALKFINELAASA